MLDCQPLTPDIIITSQRMIRSDWHVIYDKNMDGKLARLLLVLDFSFRSPTTSPSVNKLPNHITNIFEARAQAITSKIESSHFFRIAFWHQKPLSAFPTSQNRFLHTLESCRKQHNISRQISHQFVSDKPLSGQ